MTAMPTTPAELGAAGPLRLSNAVGVSNDIGSANTELLITKLALEWAGLRAAGAAERALIVWERLIALHAAAEPGTLRSAVARIPDVRALLDSIAKGTEAPVSTGLGMLDDQLDGGLWPGVHFLVGGTGGGKTQLAMQVALHASDRGVPVVYVIFEMTPEIGMLRIMGELADVPWGRLMRGRASHEQLERVEQAFARVPNALHFDAATPFEWPAARVGQLCAELRAMRPHGPALLVIDYAQLAGSLSEEARQRVASVCYAAQQEANRHRIAALLVSSTARPGYAVLADIVKAAGLSDTPAPLGGRRRTVARPHALIGLGKESGELEYSGESVTVLGAGGESEEAGRILVAATVKRRTGEPSWCALRFVAGRIREARDIQVADDLPCSGESEEALDARVLQTIQSGEYTSAEALRAALAPLRKQTLVQSIDRLIASGQILPRRKGQPIRCAKEDDADE
jgi:KaiC/GvpD/RAD55 family RecA-like ATPase